MLNHEYQRAGGLVRDLGHAPPLAVWPSQCSSNGSSTVDRSWWKRCRITRLEVLISQRFVAGQILSKTLLIIMVTTITWIFQIVQSSLVPLQQRFLSYLYFFSLQHTACWRRSNMKHCWTDHDIVNTSYHDLRGGYNCTDFPAFRNRQMFRFYLKRKINMQDRKRMFFGYKNATLDSDIIEELSATYQETFILARPRIHIMYNVHGFPSRRISMSHSLTLSQIQSSLNDYDTCHT